MSDDIHAPDDIFCDPVAYLAALGLEAELITEPLPAAA